MIGPDPAAEPRGTTYRVLLCAVGLLLVLVEVPAVGTDVANDTIGFLLVAVGAHRTAGESAAPVWWRGTATAALVAAAASLFVYGGPVSDLVAGSFVLWEAMYYAGEACTAAVVAVLAMALRPVARGPGAATLPAVALAVVLLTGTRLAVQWSQAAVSGPGRYTTEVLGAVTGLLTLVVLVHAFLAAGTTAAAEPEGPPPRPGAALPWERRRLRRKRPRSG